MSKISQAQQKSVNFSQLPSNVAQFLRFAGQLSPRTSLPPQVLSEALKEYQRIQIKPYKQA